MPLVSSKLIINIIFSIYGTPLCNRLPIHRQNANLTRLHIDSLTDSVTDSVK